MGTVKVEQNKKQTMKDKLYDLIVAISWADLSRTYFGKSSSWLYQRMEGVDDKGNPIDFTPEETEQLKGALVDLSERIRRAADNI